MRRGVAHITLNRPRQGNRIDELSARALCDAAEQIELDDQVRVVVVNGAGSVFCLGVEDPGSWEARYDWVGAIGALSRPVIAVLNGDAVAEGCELALACDLRLAATRARLSVPQLSAGGFPRCGATQRLPRLVGRMRAIELLLSGRPVSAREAERIGLVSRVVPAGRVAALTRSLTADLCARGPIAMRLAKEAVTKGLDLTLEQGVRLEQDLYVLLQTTADRREGVAAFLAGRQPKFRGR